MSKDWIFRRPFDFLKRRRPIHPLLKVTVNATVIVCSFSIPPATVQTGAVSATPQAAVARFSVPSATAQPGAVSVQASAAVIDALVPIASVQTGAASVQASATVAKLVVASAEVSSGSVEIDASPVDATFSVPSHAAQPGTIITQPSAAAAVFSVQSATVIRGTTLYADVCAAILSVPAASISLGSVSVLADASAAVFDVPAASAQTGAILVDATEVVATLDVPTVTTLIGSVSLTPSAISCSFIIPSPSLLIGAKSNYPEPISATFIVAEPQTFCGQVVLQPDSTVATFVVPSVETQIGEVLVVAETASSSFVVPEHEILTGGNLAFAQAITSVFIVPEPTMQLGGVSLQADATTVALIVPEHDVFATVESAASPIIATIFIPDVSLALSNEFFPDAATGSFLVLDASIVSISPQLVHPSPVVATFIANDATADVLVELFETHPIDFLSRRFGKILRLTTTRDSDGNVVGETYSVIFDEHNVDLQPMNEKELIVAEQLKFEATHKIYPENVLPVRTANVGDFYLIDDILYRIAEKYDFEKIGYFRALRNDVGIIVVDENIDDSELIDLDQFQSSENVEGEIYRKVVVRNSDGDVIGETMTLVCAAHSVDLQPLYDKEIVAASQLKYRASHKIFPSSVVPIRLAVPGDFYLINGTYYRIVGKFDYRASGHFVALIEPVGVVLR